MLTWTRCIQCFQASDSLTGPMTGQHHRDLNVSQNRNRLLLSKTNLTVFQNLERCIQNLCLTMLSAVTRVLMYLVIWMDQMYRMRDTWIHENEFASRSRPYCYNEVTNVNYCFSSVSSPCVFLRYSCVSFIAVVHHYIRFLIYVRYVHHIVCSIHTV